jgi:predicted SAM-dependent methyltransferase
MISRTECVICSGRLLERNIIKTIESVPVMIGTTDQPFTEDLFLDQIWSICGVCGCIQLTKLVKPETLYSTSHNPGTTGQMWSKHHEAFGKFVIDNSGACILEIGAGSDKLANYIIANKEIDQYIIVDPGVHTSLNSKIEIRSQFFDVNFSIDRMVDTIVHSHTMEHFYDVRNEIKRMSEILPVNGDLIVSVPLTALAFSLGYHNALNFQHTYMITENNLRYVLNSANFEILKFEYFNEVNVFIHAKKRDFVFRQLIDEYYENKEYFDKYFISMFDKADHIVNKIFDEIYKPTFMFGAHLFSQTPLTIYPELGSHVNAILDNDPTKHYRRLYGFSNLMVFPSSIIKNMPLCRVIVDAAQYTPEIIASLKQINPNVEIL